MIDKQIMENVRESMKDYKNGRYSGPFDTAEEAIESLHKAVRMHRARKVRRA